MKRRSQEPWIDRVFPHHVLGMPVSSWLFVLAFVALFGVLVSFIILRHEFSNIPSREETVVAEFRDLPVWRHDDEGLSYEVYWAYLKQGDKEYSCRVAAPQMILKAHQLEVGREYEFLLFYSGNRCYVQSATEIEASFQFLGEGD